MVIRTLSIWASSPPKLRNHARNHAIFEREPV